MDKKRGVFDKKKKIALSDAHLWPIVRRFALSEVHPLLKKIKNNEVDDKTRKVFINYLIVRTVSIFEIFLMNQAHRLAKKDKRKTRKLFTDIKINASIEDQVISAFSYMKLENINQVFSALLDVDFLTEIKKESVVYAPNYQYESEQIPYTKPLHKNWDSVSKIIELRHNIVHHNKLVDLKYGEIKNLIGSLLQFMMCSLMVTKGI